MLGSIQSLGICRLNRKVVQLRDLLRMQRCAPQWLFLLVLTPPCLFCLEVFPSYGATGYLYETGLFVRNGQVQCYCHTDLRNATFASSQNPGKLSRDLAASSVRSRIFD